MTSPIPVVCACGQRFAFIRGAIEQCPACGEKYTGTNKVETRRDRKSGPHGSVRNAGTDETRCIGLSLCGGPCDECPAGSKSRG